MAEGDQRMKRRLRCALLRGGNWEDLMIDGDERMRRRLRCALLRGGNWED